MTDEQRRILMGDERDHYLKSLAITQPTSALKIIEGGIELIRQERRRLDMNNWAYLVTEAGVRRVGEEHVPDCGTVACAAGWMSIRTTGTLELAGSAIATTLTAIDVIRPGSYWRTYAKGAYDELYNGLFINFKMLNGAQAGSQEQADIVIGKMQEIKLQFRGLFEAVIIDPNGVIVDWPDKNYLAPRNEEVTIEQGGDEGSGGTDDRS